MGEAKKDVPDFIFHEYWVLFIAGIGGLLYGIDIGIISAALLFLDKTIDLNVHQTSAIVAAVMGGSMISSLAAGFFADWVGRKKMIILSGLLFVASVGLIVISHAFVPLLLGRLLQGLSGGVIAVVIPLYLAECLRANVRGRGSAVFQFMLTFGIICAAAVGWFYTRQAEAAISAAAGNTALIRAAQNHAWRSMFLSVIYPGLVFFAGSFFLSESPRWLFCKHRFKEAHLALQKTSSEEEAALEMQQMESLALVSGQQIGARFRAGSLLRRKYVVPFVLACLILACTQATGVNSILAYLVVILKQAGMSAGRATEGDLAVKILNCMVTLFAWILIDRKGRKFLLTLGTSGIIIALLCAAFFFHTFESQRIDMKAQVQAAVHWNQLALSSSAVRQWTKHRTRPMALTILYSYGKGDRMTTMAGTENDALMLQPNQQTGSNRLVIEHAFLSPVPDAKTGWLIMLCLALFIACYAVGPGVVVWLTLSELMPTQIRSAGMGIALLLNQGVSTLIAGLFLPVVSVHGYYVIFLFWAACTVVYLITAVFYLPETKGKTLEEIERIFE